MRDGRFALLDTAESGFREAWSSRGAAWGDLNNSGRIWAIANNIDQQPFLYQPGGKSGGWVRFKLTGSGKKSNLDAIGARVRILAEGITQTDEVRSGESYLSSCDPRLHFGLGEATAIERVEIRWPDGQEEVHEGLAVNREYDFRQRDETGKK